MIGDMIRKYELEYEKYIHLNDRIAIHIKRFIADLKKIQKHYWED